MYINSNYVTGLDIQIGDTFTWGSSNDSATITDFTPEGIMSVVWDNDEMKNNVGWTTIDFVEFIRTMEAVYGDN